MTIEMSGEISKLAHALSSAQKSITSASKNKTNPHFKSKYADLDECWNVVREPLSSNGLSVTQWPTAQGKTVSVETVLLHTSGQWIKSSLTLEAKDATPQAIGGAITYGRRYGFSAAVGITSDEDDDGNSAQPQTPKKAPIVQPGARPSSNQSSQTRKASVIYDDSLFGYVLRISSLTGDEPFIPELKEELKGKLMTQELVRKYVHDAINKHTARKFNESLEAEAIEG